MNTFLIDFSTMSVRVAFVRKYIENALREVVCTHDSIHSLWEHSTRHRFDVIARVYPEAIHNDYDSVIFSYKSGLLRNDENTNNLSQYYSYCFGLTTLQRFIPKP